MWLRYFTGGLTLHATLNPPGVLIVIIGYSRPRARVAEFVAVALFCLWGGNVALAFDFGEVAKRAEQLAAAAYQKPSSNLPKELQTLSYDQYWSIRLKPDRTYWRGAKLPFELGFFPEGMYYDQPVRINEVAPDGVREIKFEPGSVRLRCSEGRSDRR